MFVAVIVSGLANVSLLQSIDLGFRERSFRVAFTGSLGIFLIQGWAMNSRLLFLGGR
jgi:hypothetical protein